MYTIEDKVNHDGIKWLVIAVLSSLFLAI